MLYSDTKKLSERDQELINYYNYISINPGLTFRQFENEDNEVIEAIIHLRIYEQEKAKKKK